MYRIEKITYKDGTEKLTTDYAARKYCVGEFMYELSVGKCLWFEYAYDNQGDEKIGKCLRTSQIESFADIDENNIIVETLNSVYYFKKVV